MTRMAWLQSRTQNLLAAGALAIVAALLAATGPHLVHLYNDVVAGCAARGDCSAARDSFLRSDASLRTALDALVMVMPAFVGIFWGAPMVARELESGTYSFAWTQSVSRARWLGVKLGLLGLASVAAAGLLSLAVTWWAAPLDHAHMAKFTTFDERDVVPLGYAAFAFALAVLAGVVIRRTLPAIVAALLLFVGARLAVWHWVRPHLAAVSQTNLPMTEVHRVGFIPGPAGPEFTVGNGSIDNAWVLSGRIVDKAGHPTSSAGLHHFLETNCPLIANHIAHSPRGGGPPNLNAMRDCFAQVTANFDLHVTYQPPGHYWQLQWFELAIFLAASLALSALSFWWVRRRSG